MTRELSLELDNHGVTSLLLIQSKEFSFSKEEEVDADSVLLGIHYKKSAQYRLSWVVEIINRMEGFIEHLVCPMAKYKEWC